ncbi:hypothetical protein PVAND_001212 [Polypedilum vanderplanki]|uniref:PEHE domain-containing protein n=1 Tax=Polypedilum vanderplanki TaxID=319348 RepID=A0A9J6BNI3_POLVA|nr:hypothetical protein PVAND_001212 [Polypedilum vanderplanki]
MNSKDRLETAEMLLLQKETETPNKISSSENASTTQSTAEETTDVSSAVVNSDNLTESLEQQQQQQQNNCIVPTEDLPKIDQYILDSITAAASSSSTSITSTNMGFAGYNNQNYCVNGTSNGTQNSTSSAVVDSHEMPQLLNILNELLDGQDISSLANSGGNGDNIMVEEQEENYEDDSPRKDDPDEIVKVVIQQRLQGISKEEQQLRRRMDFLIRRLYKLVSRSTGMHVSEEIAGFLEHVARYSKKKEIKEKSHMSTKFPYLNSANLQPTTVTPPLSDLLASPTFSSEPPINLLSSPSTSNSQEQQHGKQQSLPPQTSTTTNTTINDSNTNDNTATIDVIEPSTKNESLKPVPMKEMKSFLRRIDNVSSMQSTVLTKRALAFKYFSKSSTASSSNLNQTLKLESSFNVSAIPKCEDADVDQIDQTSGLLMSEMRLIENQIDSDATASSTGGESADEMTVYNNNYQQPLSISKRAAYKYAKDRGAVASRWCWLATQISEVDIKIRQCNDYRRFVREGKGVVELETKSVEGHELPGNNLSATYSAESENDEGENTSARIRPFVKSKFRKRKLVRIAHLHQTSEKAARPSTLKCGCSWPLQPCALCTARLDPTAPRECTDILPETERVALLDPCFHPVLSFPEDVSSSVHLEAIMNIPEWQTKMIRSSPKSIMKHATKQLDLLSGGNGSFKDDYKLFGMAKPNAFDIDKKMRKNNIDALTGKRKYTKRFMKMDGQLAGNKDMKERKKYKKRRPSLGLNQSMHVPRKYTFKKRLRKLDGYHHQHLNGINGSDKHFDPYNRSKNSSPTPNHKSERSTEPRRSRNYDIDNIVIPYSVAAAGRIEILSYKEIPTPKWREITTDEDDQQLITEEENARTTGEVPTEDVTDESITFIHEKALADERKKFETYLKFPLTSRSRANRRIDSRGNESSGANTPTPDQTPVHGDLETSIPSPLDNSVFHETPSITALLNNVNGRKERKRTTSKKDEVNDGGGGYLSGANSRCISPEPIKEIIPAYEPLNFPLSDVSLHRMKRAMPMEHLKPINNKHSNLITSLETGTSHVNHQHHSMQTNVISLKHARPIKRRKHNDSISESILIKEKLPSASLATIGKNNNVLIPRNRTILDKIDLKGTDEATLKKLINNNNGDLINGDDFNDDEDDNSDDEMDDNSDSETVTGDESLFEPEEVSEEETESEEEYLDEVELDRKHYRSNKRITL